jgi:hypothetical protein
MMAPDYSTGREYVEFVLSAARRRQERHDERLGQAFFNVIHLGYPGIANSIRSTPFDPFFRDEVKQETLDKVASLFDEVAGEKS